jgi:endonuclease YncB( thermonuclease family)
MLDSSWERRLPDVQISALQAGRSFMEMVRDGFACRYPQYDKPGESTAAENDAHEHQRGVRADLSPMPPWEWRRKKGRALKSP